MINEERLQTLMGQALIDFGATMNAPLVVIGDKLGLYKTLADRGPLNSAELAEKTDTKERYVREWLGAQTAGGYVTYDPDTDTYCLSPEQALMFADDTSPAFVVGGFQVALAASKIESRLEQAFRSGEGIGWHEHHHSLFEGTERFFRPGYAANLVESWIPALDGVMEKLQQGGRVADVGCGHGASTVLMAQAFPNSSFIGFDYHEGSIAAAHERAQEAGVADRVQFETASAKDFNGAGYDLVTVFDCLHDLGDPVGAAHHILSTLDKDGTWMIVEPRAGDTLTENLNPVGRAFYAASTMVCTPNSLDQEVGRALGAQAGEAQIRAVTEEGGFTRFRRAAETPINLIFEARP